MDSAQGMTLYGHVIWDWNGTLLDDAWLSLEVINGMLRQRGQQAVSADRYAQVFGFPLEEYCRKLGFDVDREGYERLSDAFVAEYERRRTACRLRPGARGVLHRLQACGIAQSLLSAYRHELLVELVAAMGIDGVFTAILGVDNSYGAGKAAAGRRHVAELRVAPDRVLLVGDTLHDLDVARAMGVDCALVPSGHQHRERWQGHGVRVIDALEQVVTLVTEGRGGTHG